MAASASARNTYQKGNAFEKILKGELPSKKIYEDDDTYAFLDINPAAPVHILVIPKKKQVFSFDEFVEACTAEEVGNFFKTIRKVAHQAGIPEEGYRVVMNHGMFAEQMVPSFHVHIMGGRVLGQMTTVPDHQIDHGRVKKADAAEEKKAE